MSDKTFKIMLLSINSIAVVFIMITGFILHSVWQNISAENPSVSAISEENEVSAEYNQNYSTPNPLLSQETEEAPAMASYEDVFIVKEHNGRVTVFLDDSTVPYMELEIKVEDLTEEDARLLQKGIKANTVADLINILEDYDY